MKLSIVRGGGIGPTTRTELDADKLGPEDTATFHDKLHQAETAAHTQPPPPRALPDELQYEVTLDDEQRGPRTVRYSDSTLPETVRELIAFADSQPASTTQIEN